MRVTVQAGRQRDRQQRFGEQTDKRQPRPIILRSSSKGRLRKPLRMALGLFSKQTPFPGSRGLSASGNRFAPS